MWKQGYGPLSGRLRNPLGLGRRRIDLLVQWPLDKNQGFQGPIQRAVIELKILHQSLVATIEEGLVRTADYMDHIDTETGYLVIFDRTPYISWKKKLFVGKEQYGKYQIEVWGM